MKGYCFLLGWSELYSCGLYQSHRLVHTYSWTVWSWRS